MALQGETPTAVRVFAVPYKCTEMYSNVENLPAAKKRPRGWKETEEQPRGQQDR